MARLKPVTAHYWNTQSQLRNHTVHMFVNLLLIRRNKWCFGRYVQEGQKFMSENCEHKERSWHEIQGYCRD